MKNILTKSLSLMLVLVLVLGVVTPAMAATYRPKQSGCVYQRQKFRYRCR
jgi:hypothetical protein